MAISIDRKAKIIALKYDDGLKGFIIKRINGSCELHYLYTHITNLLQQDINELRNLFLVNHMLNVQAHVVSLCYITCLGVINNIT